METQSNIMDVQASTSINASIVVEENLELSFEQAVKLTESIRNTSKVLWVLISRAHLGKAWVALGYPSWGSYVTEEFDISRSRSYQLLNQDRVIKEIESALPEGTHINISEAEARDLRVVLDEVIPQIKSRTEGLSAQDASLEAQKILDSNRAQVQERGLTYAQIDPEDDSNLNYKSNEYKDLNFDNESDGPAPVLKDLPTRTPISEAYQPTEMPASPPKVGLSPETLATIRQNVNAMHDLYSSISALSALSVDNFEKLIEIIPPEKHDTINKNIAQANKNLAAFTALWAEKANKVEFDENEDDDE